MIPVKGTILILASLCFDKPASADTLIVNSDIETNVYNLNSPEKKYQQKSKPGHYKRGDTLYYCEVLKLRNINHKEHILAVFSYSHILARKGRSKMKIKYVLNREKAYLSRIFYAKATVLEKKRVDMKVNKYMKGLERKYPIIKMWGVLDANAITRTEIVSLQ